MAFEEDFDDERPRADVPLPPEDRLWRHPSEVAGAPRRPLPTAPSRPRRRATGLALGAAAVAGAVVAVTAMWVVRPTRTVTIDQATPSTTVTAAWSAPLSTEDLVAELTPSLTAVSARQGSTWQYGTGIWLDAQGTVAVAAPLTAGTSSLLITRPDGTRTGAELVASDPGTGVAVLQVSKTAGTSLENEPSAPRAGRPVAVIGAEAMAPSGEMSSRITTATVSAAGLRVMVGNTVVHDLFQLDRAVPANAVGSVVVDAEAKVLGIVLLASGDDDLAVVAPAAGALDAARALRDGGELEPGHLGVQAVDVDPGTAGMLEIAGGAQVTAVEADSAASEAGLLVGDVIVAIDDQPIGGASDLVVSLRGTAPASAVEVRWRRGTEELSAPVTLG